MADENPYSPPQPPPPSDAAFTEQLEAPQSVTVVPQPTDYLAFVDHLNNTDETVRRVLRRQTVAWLVASGVVFVAGSWIELSAPDFAPLANVMRGGAIFLAVYSAFRSTLAKWKSRRQFARSIKLGLQGKVDESMTITLEERGVRIQDSGGDGVRYWSGINRVASTDQHLFLYLMPAQAVILPLRTFQSEAQFRGWCDLAGWLWKKGQKDLPSG